MYVCVVGKYLLFPLYFPNITIFFKNYHFFQKEWCKLYNTKYMFNTSKWYIYINSSLLSDHSWCAKDFLSENQNEAWNQGLVLCFLILHILFCTAFENDQSRYHFSVLTLYFADAFIFPSGRTTMRNSWWT